MMSCILQYVGIFEKRNLRYMFQFVGETLKRLAQMIIYKYNMPDNMHFECAFFTAENKTQADF